MPIELRYRIVDVFTARPLSGNALCVVLDPAPEPVMQAIAREVNLSETTFPVVVDDMAYEMRVFTPTAELPFAGHPSLGTAWTLGPGRWTQTTSGATIEVSADADGAVMRPPEPTFRDVDPLPAVAALGLTDVEGAFLADSGGVRHVVVPTALPVDRLAPDPGEVAAAARRLGGISLCPLRRLDDHTLHVRVFAPAAGVPEDPGTGSVAAPAAILARRLWGTGEEVVILQGAEVGRPSRMDVGIGDGELRVGGRVVGVAEGRFTL